MAWIFNGEHRVHQRWEVTEVDTADSAVELIERIWLAALKDTDSGQVPVIRNIGKCRVRPGGVWNLDLEIGAEYICAVIVGKGIGVVQVIGIVAGEEQTNVALFIVGMAEGVAGADLKIMRQAFFKVRFKRIVSGVANRFEECRVRAVTDIRHTEVGIAAVGRVPGLVGDAL